MKKNTTTTTEATTTPAVPESTITAAAAAAMLDHVESLDAMAKEAMNGGMSESDFIRYISMTFFSQASDLDMLKSIQQDAATSYEKAVNEKAESESIEAYQDLNSAERIMAKVTKTLIDFCDSEIAKEINHMVYENASSVKVACFIGQHKSDSKAMTEIEYIYESIKCEKELNRFAGTFTRVYKELCE